MLDDRVPQVTFSCDKREDTCTFQFWVGGIESFYCALDTCTMGVTPEVDYNLTEYKCENLKCSCVTGRFLCGENGSVGTKYHNFLLSVKNSTIISDLDEFLQDEIKGPAKFSCKTGSGCQFEEPAMNDMINDIFGDRAIFLACDGGECLHYSQVPGYKVSGFYFKEVKSDLS